MKKAVTKTKDEHSMRDLFHENAVLVEQALIQMGECIKVYCAGNFDEAKKRAAETVQIEKKQDRLRDELIARLFTKETMVFSRADRLAILERMDRVADRAEIVVRTLVQFNPTLPTALNPGLKSMGENAQYLGTELKGLLDAVFEDFSLGKPYITKITDIRREIRETQWKLSEENYALRPDYLEFHYFQSLITVIGKLADQVEEFSDEIYGLLCKYAL